MEEQNIKNLLKDVQAKIDLYEKHKELSGENFNIFSIMGMESDEVFTHSAIIAEFLNPKGSHGMESKPLELFITQFIDNEFEFSCENVSCVKEHFIGIINEDKSEGGRLDIVVKNSLGQIFAIENKIYAFEQENQLLRYKKKYPDAKIFYLTLHGSESKQIVGNENIDNKIYTTISYKDDILNWLENCVPLAYNKPMVREVLNQYIYLIKKLTNQTTSEKMSEEIIKIINENFKASEEIFKNFEKALLHKRTKFLEKIANHLKSSIQSVMVENINNSPRLKLILAEEFFISFHFKSNLGLLLIGNSAKEFHLNDEIFTTIFEDFKLRDWNKNYPSHYLFWKHQWGEFGSSSKLLESESTDYIEEENDMIQELIRIANNFSEKYIK